MELRIRLYPRWKVEDIFGASPQMIIRATCEAGPPNHHDDKVDSDQ